LALERLGVTSEPSGGTVLGDFVEERETRIWELERPVYERRFVDN